MKQLLAALPLCLLVHGCAAQSAATPDDAASSTATTSTSTAKATSEEMPSNAPPMGASSAASESAAKNGKTSDANGPDPRYRVVDETQPGLPADVVAAMNRAKTTPPPAKMVVAAHPRLRLVTSKGAITVELDSKAAPLQVKSFIYLANRKFFDNTRFHRYVEDFVIQGGDPLSKDPIYSKYASGNQSPVGTGGPGYQIPREYNSLKHDAMVIAAARSGDPDSASSQFYFTLKAQPSLDRENSQDGFGYTVFGRVIAGMDVVLKLRQGDKLQSVQLIR